MSHEKINRLRCDRCGRQEDGCDEWPTGWMSIEGRPLCGGKIDDIGDLCQSCIAELKKWWAFLGTPRGSK